MSWQISAIKTSQEWGRNGQFERRGNARKNGAKLRLAVFGCQIGKMADSQRNSGEEKHKILWCFGDLKGVYCGGQCPFCFGLYLGKDEGAGSNPVSSSSAAARRTSQHPAH